MTGDGERRRIAADHQRLGHFWRVPERIQRLFQHFTVQGGALVITAQRFREQDKNRADARARLIRILRAAATPPKPRRATKVPKASKRARLDAKKRRARLKEGRTRPDS